MPAGTVYGNIVNCNVKNAQVFGSYWQAGILAAQFNSGNIIDCTVEKCEVYSGSAVGAFVGIINESAGTRKIENCKVIDCVVAKNGGFGGVYDTFFGAAVGLINVSNAKIYFNNVVVSGNTVLDEASNALWGVGEEDNDVYVDGTLY